MNEWSYSGEETRPRKRGQVLLQSAFYVPLFVITAGAFLFALAQIVTGEYGYIVMLTLATIVGVPLGYQALHVVRDINAALITTEGEVRRKWTKGNLMIFFMPSYYISLEGKIFSIPKADYGGLLEGDLVRVQHFPNSLIVEELERYDEMEKKFIPASSGGTAY
jgi:hypothetical protein